MYDARFSDIEMSVVNVYLASSITGGGIGIENDLELYRKSLVRLVDKAIFEYTEVRNVVKNQKTR